MEPLAICAAAGVTFFAVCGIVALVRSCRKPVMKLSRSENDLTNLVADSLPTGRSPV